MRGLQALKLAATLASVLILGSLIGCGSKQSSQSFIIGGILSKTGGAARYGAEAENGARLALEQKQQAGDLNFAVDFIVLDDKSQKTEAAKLIRTLVDVNKANVVLGPAISPSALAIGRFVEERQVPTVGTSPTQDEVTEESKYITRVCFHDAVQGKMLARFLYNELGARTATIIYDNTLSYSIGLSETFRAEFTKLGGSVPYEEHYSVDDTDYNALITKVATYDVDALFIPGWDENVGPMLKQSKDKWDDFILLGGDAWPSNALLELAGGNVHDRVFALSHYSPDDPDSLVQHFQQAYKERFGEDSSPFAALGYDAMMLILDSAERSDSWDGPALMNAILSTKDLQLVTGTFSFDENRNPIKDAVIVKIEPESIHFYQRIRL